MKDEVLDDIRSEISSPITSKRQVVYIMSLIRKLFEHYKIRNYRLVGLYCDWVLHTKLDRRGARDILDSFGGPQKRSAQLKVSTFEGLRKSLGRLLDRFGLPKNIIKENWFQFRKNLLFTLIDVPLENPKASIKKFVFTKSAIPGFTGKHYITYEITLKNGGLDGGSILLADQDEETKEEMREVEQKFERRFRFKVYGKIMKQAERLSDPEKSALQKKAEKLVEGL
jgi:hypothetical protein